MLSPKLLKAIPTHDVTTECLTTPVHRCLSVSEILRLIFEFVRLWDEDERRRDVDEDTDDSDEDGRQSRDGKKALASLARTCRSFSVVALDVLWRVLDSLDPLFTICPKPEVRRFSTILITRSPVVSTPRFPWMRQIGCRSASTQNASDVCRYGDTRHACLLW